MCPFFFNSTSHRPANSLHYCAAHRRACRMASAEHGGPTDQPGHTPSSAGAWVAPLLAPSHGSRVKQLPDPTVALLPQVVKPQYLIVGSSPGSPMSCGVRAWTAPTMLSPQSQSLGQKLLVGPCLSFLTQGEPCGRRRRRGQL